MGQVLDTCRSRKGLKADDALAPAVLSKLDKELNDLGGEDSWEDEGEEEETAEGTPEKQETFEKTDEEVEEYERQQKAMFEDYCQKWLDIGNLESYYDPKVVETGNKILKLDYFLLVFKSVFFWKKLRFEGIKDELYNKRRAAYYKQDPDIDLYKQIVRQQEQLEGMCMQLVLDKILEKLGMTEIIFNQNVEHYSKDPESMRKMKQITSITQETMLELKSHYLGLENKAKLVTVEQALIIYKLKIETQIQLLSQLYSFAEVRPATQDKAYQIIRPMMIDIIFQKTGGVEWEEMEDKVFKIVQEQINAGNEAFKLLTDQYKEKEAEFTEWHKKTEA